eukprot:889748_1
MSITTTTLSTLLAILSSAFVSSSDEWNYENFNWGKSDNFCGSQHHEQSPINIDEGGLSDNCPSSLSLDWALGPFQNGDITSFELKNTGHSLQITPKGNKYGLGVLANRFGSGGAFCLDQFHLHWG